MTDTYDPFAELSTMFDEEFATENKKLSKIANISITIPDQYYPDNGESGGETEFLVHGGKKLSHAELAKYRVESSENTAKELAGLIKERTDITDMAKIDVSRVFNNGLLIDYGLTASRTDEETQIPKITYHDREATKKEKEANEGEWRDWANRTELPKVTHTLGDMRAWYRLLNDGQPYHSILTFGHGKDRVVGEGWSGGEAVAGRANATERAFVKKLGQPLYTKYMDELLEKEPLCIGEAAPRRIIQNPEVRKRAHVRVPLIQRAVAVPQANIIPITTTTTVKEPEPKKKRHILEKETEHEERERMRA